MSFNLELCARQSLVTYMLTALQPQSQTRPDTSRSHTRQRYLTRDHASKSLDLILNFLMEVLHNVPSMHPPVTSSLARRYQILSIHVRLAGIMMVNVYRDEA